MLKIRLKRLGRKKKPFYRIIAIDSRNKRDGRSIEELGFYDPISKNKKINFVEIQNKIKHGAQITDTVKALIENKSC
uniref:Small ribosomal subunit protein bS16c n=1 Tax=Polysiphonia scopulorum TaxID=257860 RepID=A0A1Z1MHX9_9FLOR|nr:ribosomal protein S16 [Polysiphonia scopulorum]ARW65690.1 ribosomal protein S16 [Polysiphonia scopulorum]